MNKLFTTYESIEPPEIITPEVLQNYQEIQSLIIPNNLNEDLSFLELEDDPILDKPDIKKWDFVILTDKEDSAVKNVIDTARSFIGEKYSWGGSNPITGFDCSGLMQFIFRNAGIDLPRTATQQGKVGREVDINQAKPGDIIWFGSKNSPSGQHIGLISKIENGQIYIIDAAGKKLGVVERALPDLQIKSIRRVFRNNSLFADTVINFFTDKGLTENQSRGILGNLIQESSGDHTAVNKKSGAFGLALWLGSRKLKLFQKYGKNPTMLQLLNFIWEELNTTEKNALLKLLNTNTVVDATKVFANHFERAGKDEMNMNKRINYAYLV